MKIKTKTNEQGSNQHWLNENAFLCCCCLPSHKQIIGLDAIDLLTFKATKRKLNIFTKMNANTINNQLTFSKPVRVTINMLQTREKAKKKDVNIRAKLQIGYAVW